LKIILSFTASDRNFNKGGPSWESPVFSIRVVRSKRPKRLPAVFTCDEALMGLERLEGMERLMANLLYGAGVRLMECLRLRVKDIDFEYKQIVVKDGKGHKDRITMLPESLIEPLRKHMEFVKSPLDRVA